MVSWPLWPALRTAVFRFLLAITIWCGTLSLLVQVTGVFGAAETGSGSNLKPAILTLAPCASAWPGTCPVSIAPVRDPSIIAAEAAAIGLMAFFPQQWMRRIRGLLPKSGRPASRPVRNPDGYRRLLQR